MGVFSDVDDGPTKHYLLNNRKDEAVKKYYGLSFSKRPGEELYEIASTEEFNGITTIGAWDGEGSPYLFFNGDIDDVVIWNRALSSDEIKFIRQMGSADKSFNDWPPQFNNALITRADAIEGAAYADSISLEASDPDGGTVSYTKTIGPDWLETGCVDTPSCGGADLSDNGSVSVEDLQVLADNWMATSFPVIIYASSVVVDTVNGSFGRVKGRATITVSDNYGNAIEGATVTGSFTGDLSETIPAVTDSNGVAVIISLGQITNPSFTFCVDDISDASLNYDSEENVVTCESY